MGQEIREALRGRCNRKNQELKPQGALRGAAEIAEQIDGIEAVRQRGLLPVCQNFRV